MNIKEEIKHVTLSLIQYVSILEEKFNDKTIEPENTELFFNYVKEDTKEVFKQLEKWVAILMDQNKKEQPIIPVSIISSTKDNMTALIMHSYYKDVRRRRYMEINRSCIYTLQSVLSTVE